MAFKGFIVVRMDSGACFISFSSWIAAFSIFHMCLLISPWSSVELLKIFPWWKLPEACAGHFFGVIDFSTMLLVYVINAGYIFFTRQLTSARYLWYQDWQGWTLSDAACLCPRSCDHLCAAVVLKHRTALFLSLPLILSGKSNPKNTIVIHI
jgi:hypothetical protein